MTSPFTYTCSSLLLPCNPDIRKYDWASHLKVSGCLFANDDVNPDDLKISSTSNTLCFQSLLILSCPQALGQVPLSADDVNCSIRTFSIHDTLKVLGKFFSGYPEAKRNT